MGLYETVYCAQPAGFEDPAHLEFVCRLNKSLYGLKQAPRAWYSRFATHLLSLGFVEAKADTSLFIYRRGTDTVYLLLYVDDIVLTASSVELLCRTIGALQQEFAMKDLGELHHFLGMEVQRCSLTSTIARAWLTSSLFLLRSTATRSFLLRVPPFRMPLISGVLLEPYST